MKTTGEESETIPVVFDLLGDGEFGGFTSDDGCGHDTVGVSAMMKLGKIVAVMAGLLLAAAGSQALAVCTQDGNIFPIFQCGFRAFFAPMPPGGGTASGVWWQLGYGNGGVANGFGGSGEGTGIGPTGVFSGNDSGDSTFALTSAASVLPGAPAGALCSNFENSWGAPGVDGCADDPRTGAAYDNDNLLNPYWGGPYGVGTLTSNYQIDYPMGFLVTESSKQFFAVAFVANKTRAANAADTAQGMFDLGEVTNGGPNPLVLGQNDVVPWQAIPRQNVDATTFTNPGDKLNSDRMLALSWPAPAVHHDGSVRPSGRPLANAGNGVGVLDQGSLVRYVVEGAPTTTPNPDPDTLPWVVLTSTAMTTANVTVPPDTAIRLRTIFGKTPSASGTGLSDARAGRLGDLGYGVAAAPTIIAGPLISERALEVRAVRKKNVTEISWTTSSELTATGFTIIGRSGGREHTIKQVPCKACGTGDSASYIEQIGADLMKGAKQIKIRMNGPDTDSALVNVD